ncbi:hypothetical protein GCM10022631_17850 [Deinococcus rubellus]
MPRPLFAPQEDIGDDIEILAQGQVLEDRRNAEIECRRRINEFDWLTVKKNLSCARLMDASKNFDQRRLASAVVTDKRNNFTGMNVKFDIAERRDGTEMLGDAAQAEHRLSARDCTFWKITHFIWPSPC